MSFIGLQRILYNGMPYIYTYYLWTIHLYMSTVSALNNSSRAEMSEHHISRSLTAVRRRSNLTSVRQYLATMLKFDRREPLNEAHDYMFGILENYHCWRFHGPGLMRPFEIVQFCTRMHHEYFSGRQSTSVFPIYVRKYRKYAIDRWTVVYTLCASAVIWPSRQ